MKDGLVDEDSLRKLVDFQIEMAYQLLYHVALQVRLPHYLMKSI